MQKKNILKVLIFTFIVLMSQLVRAQIHSTGIEIPKTLNYIENEPLYLYGAGTRKILWLDMYVGVIFLNEKNLTPNQIIESRQPMAIRLHIISTLVSKKRIIKAIEDGFDKTTNGNLAQYKSRIDKMIGFFNEEIQPNDIIDLVCYPSGKIDIFRNSKLKGTLQGHDFKQALFGMWISENAVDKKMKSELLNAK